MPDKHHHGDSYRRWQTGGEYHGDLFTTHEFYEEIAYIEHNPLRRQPVN